MNILVGSLDLAGDLPSRHGQAIEVLRHLHDAAEPDDEVELQLVPQKIVERLVVEATIREDSDLHALRQDLVEPLVEHALVLVPPALQPKLHHRLPDQRHDPAVAGDHRQNDGGLVVIVEISPVEGRDY